MGEGIVTDQGWSWIVLFNGFLLNFIVDGIMFSFGVFYLAFLEAFQQGESRTSWLGSVLSGIYLLSGPLVSVLANRFGYRKMTIIGSVIAGTGFFMSTFSPNIWIMLLTYGVMGGLGFGCVHICSYTTIAHFFDKRRCFATGIMSCGSGVGTIVFPILIVFLFRIFKWQTVLMMLSAVIIASTLCGATFRNMSKKEDDNDESGKGKKLFDVQLLKSPALIVLSTASVVNRFIGFFVPFFYLPDYATHIGLTTNQGALLLSIIGITNTIGRLVCGYLSDKKWADPLMIHNGMLIIGGAATMGIMMFKSFPLLVIYALVFGLSFAAHVSLTPIILIDLFGVDKLSNAFGLLTMFRGLAVFIGAPLAGFLLSKLGGHEVVFLIAGASIALSGIICVPLRFIPYCRPQLPTTEPHIKAKTDLYESTMVEPSSSKCEVFQICSISSPQRVQCNDTINSISQNKDSSTRPHPILRQRSTVETKVLYIDPSHYKLSAQISIDKEDKTMCQTGNLQLCNEDSGTRCV